MVCTLIDHSSQPISECKNKTEQFYDKFISDEKTVSLCRVN